MPDGYEGDVSPEECWRALGERPDAVLLDVRTVAEWTYVGLPVLETVNKRPVLVEWQSFPSMGVDPTFTEKAAERIAEAGGSRQSPIFCICRSGARSIAGAQALTAAGYEHCFNVLEGFEGPPDSDGHRGAVAGWKAAGLPWAQR